jgi:hypothetical protein
MPEDSDEKSSATSAIILVVIIIAIAVYSSAFGLQTLQWIDGHRWAAANPWLKEAPLAAPAPAGSQKPAVAIAQPGTTQLTAYSYQFIVPWTGKYKESPSSGGAEFRFPSGQVVVFGDPDANLDTLRILRDSPSPDYAPFQALIASGALETNYQLYQAVYGASPAQVSPVTPYAVAQRNRVLLLTKLSFGFDLEKNISSFEFGENKGFQFGNPAQGPVALRVFNSHDRQFRFLFTTAAGSGGQITQSDIDQAIQSLQQAL